MNPQVVLWPELRPADLLDILVVAVLIYLGLSWLRQRSSRAAIVGILLLVALYAMARFFDMYLTAVFFQVGFTAMLLALVLIFQEDIRRGFEWIASWRLWSPGEPPTEPTTALDELVEAVERLAEDRIGALVVIHGRQSLARHMRGGVPIHGRVSLPLLYSIFHPGSPGHDGAVIMQGNRIQQFSVHLPLSKNVAQLGEGGTRHAAALGLAERSDAMVIVVSEERGTVSVAENGQIEQLETSEQLMERLKRVHALTAPSGRSLSWRNWLLSDLRIKGFSVALATLLWFLATMPIETLQRTVVAPIQYANLPESWMLEEPIPTAAQVTIAGRRQLFTNFRPGTVLVSVDMSRVQQGEQEIALTEDNVQRPAGMSILKVEPSSIIVRASRLVAIRVPVQVRLSQESLDNRQVARVSAVPSSVVLLVRPEQRDEITKVKTEEIPVAGEGPTQRIEAPLVVPEGARLGKNSKPTVTVEIELRREPQPEGGKDRAAVTQATGA